MTISQYDVYLFDWDGTLAKSHDMWLELVRIQLEPCGIKLSDEQLVRQIFGRYDEGMKELGFSDTEIDRLGTELENAAKEQYKLVDLFSDAREVLEALKAKNKKLGLVTATYRDAINVAVGNHQLFKLFDVVVTGDEMTAQKPDPSGLLLALEKVGVPPAQALMSGDSPKDLLAGKNAGTDTLLFYPPEHESQHPLRDLQKCQPTYTIHAWRELLDRLQ